jgi:hypothetical protein
LGLGERIRDPTSDYHLHDNDYHHDDGANNNDHRCANNYNGSPNHDHYNYNYVDYHNGSACLTSLCSCRDCIFLELVLRHESHGN